MGLFSSPSMSSSPSEVLPRCFIINSDISYYLFLSTVQAIIMVYVYKEPAIFASTTSKVFLSEELFG